MSTMEARALVERLRAERTPFVLATVVRAERPTSAKPGDSAVVLPDGSIDGFVGGVCAESTVRLEGLRLLRAGESGLLRVTPSAGDGAQDVDGVRTVENPCLSGGTLEIFLEAVIPPVLVHVSGSSPVARALVRVGAALDFDVRAAEPDAPIPADTTAVVVASHGRDEEPVLRAAVAAKVPYVALVASPKRAAAVLGGLDPADRAAVKAPAGLDIGARTPEEIALSVYAEIVARRPRPAPLGTVPEPAGSAAPSEPAEALDPVCGMTVAISAASISAQHGGWTRYFCGTGCREAFRADPTRYP